jgi:hypothetical protein
LFFLFVLWFTWILKWYFLSKLQTALPRVVTKHVAEKRIETSRVAVVYTERPSVQTEGNIVCASPGFQRQGQLEGRSLSDVGPNPPRLPLLHQPPSGKALK